MADIDNDNITTSEEEVKLSLKQQIRELKKQLNEFKPYKDKIPLDPDYFCKYQKKLYDEKLGQKVPCELCGRIQNSQTYESPSEETNMFKKPQIY